ncbi:class I SAM-dependent DNA methyltransferase [Mycobacterium talmoniae]|uniref:Methyltransferase n=1 Tax=Mycobacterium talmoniae TaxID=1858794 RepID=A0A1S1NH86_9MYCO|nr:MULTISPECIES: class I SAM-dependent methyltransferase [Mycobacterium]OHV02038.1 methyltransferase [Mycobacterium talmoniae]PQM49012.1 Malonyl-[acyl-carrier protein] O-methyltransferase [Mycobacterium talmoniae]TDH50370.1 class I SAM-dependent methyltransferase [Mycobacterium eburneum]
MGEPDFLRLTRDGYDRTAGRYADRFQHHLDDKPVDRAMLAAFAGLVTAGDNTRVVDVGCGTGVATAILRGLGVDACGIDLSANMVAEARRRNPGLDFGVGSLTDLELADASVGGVCAWYAIIHLPDAHLPAAFAEFHRVLAPGGLVLLAFQVGDRPRALTEAFGAPVALTFYRRQPDTVAARLTEAGLPVYAQLVRQPDDDTESTPHAYLIARKPR